MKVPAELGAKLCGVLGVAWSDGYKTLDDFAAALERVAAEAKVQAARQRAAESGDKLIG